MCGEQCVAKRISPPAGCGNRSSFKTTRRSRRTRVPVGFPAYRWSAHPYGRALLRRTCAFWLVLGRRVGEIPWEPRTSTVGAEETLSEFAGTGRSTQTLLPAQPSPSKRETTPANAVMTRPKASHSRPEDGRVRASVKLYPITISDRAAGQPRLLCPLQRGVQ